MKTLLWCVGFAAAFTILVVSAKEPVVDRADDTPLGGFLKPGEKVALIEVKDPPSLSLRIANAKDLELVKKVKSSDEIVQILDKKAITDALDKQGKSDPAAAIFQAIGLFDADEINALVNRALKAIQICSVVSVHANYVVLKFDEPPAKEILVPIHQIRRIQRGDSIMDER